VRYGFGFAAHGLAVLLSAVPWAGTSAAAAKFKYTYLKIGEGGGASVYAFTSKQACETARRKHGQDWARMISKLKKQTKSGGTFAAAPRAKCLDSLPLGFVRPKMAD
jgi:hypothetical protein